MSGMCGRYTIKTSAKELANLFGELPFPDFEPRYNVAPTQPVMCVRRQDADLQAVMMRWGLVPSWAKDVSIGNKMINARAETVAEKPSYRAAFKRRRCLVVADGFYEWKKLSGRGKQPWYFTLQDDGPFAFAGLWESWQSPDGSELETCTLITGEPNNLVKPVHDRMPVILPPECYELWMDPQVEGGAQLVSLLVPYPAAEMKAHPVSDAVNSPRNDSPQLIDAIAI